MSRHANVLKPVSSGTKPLLVKADEACRMLGAISTRTLSRLEERGLIRSVKLIRCKLYALKDIEALVDQQGGWKP